jgi:RES domain-containing protein
MIHVIRSGATKQQMDEMLQSLGTYIKLAVDIQRGILAGGGVMHADCESALLEEGCRQEDVWGADWSPSAQQVTFESLINIRPRQSNPSMEILDPAIREQVAVIVQRLLGGI